MRLIIAIWALAIMTINGQSSQHKLEHKVERMTPQQLVEEYCNLSNETWYGDTEYSALLMKYIKRNVPNVVPHLSRIIDSYDPIQDGKENRGKYYQFSEAEILLAEIDDTVVRLRTFEAGKQAITALNNTIEKMKNAHFDTAQEFERRNRYDIALSILKSLEGINFCDQAINNTLKVKIKINLSNEELQDFIAYITLKNPYYPSLCERELYRDMEHRNSAGNPLQYHVIKEGEVFLKLCAQYQSEVTRKK